MTNTEIYTVKAWHEALNEGDIERVVALSHPDIEVGGPRGTARGIEVLREWAGRAGVQLKPQRICQRGNVVVVEQGAEWRSAQTGQTTDSQTVASVFVVRDGKVASVMRYPDLVTALRAAGLDESQDVLD